MPRTSPEQRVFQELVVLNQQLQRLQAFSVIKERVGEPLPEEVGQLTPLARISVETESQALQP